MPSQTRSQHPYQQSSRQEASDGSDIFVPGDLLEAPILISLLLTRTPDKYQMNIQENAVLKGRSGTILMSEEVSLTTSAPDCGRNKLCREDYKDNCILCRISSSLRLDSNLRGFEKSMIAARLSICFSLLAVPSGRIMSQLNLQSNSYSGISLPPLFPSF